MEFPKAVMTTKELVSMGFSDKQLRKIAETQGFPIAIREGFGKTAAIKFDTAELYKYIQRISKIMERS